jgi:methyltransferase (TIGR00027 family)
MPIENVSDTARWVAVYRAMESARSDAIFRDPYAERLAGAKGHQIVEELKQGRQMAWSMVTRTSVLDEMILDRITNGGVDTVINLAAGLDTRAWRLALPPALQWFDVDLPAMTAYKQEQMRGETPVCRYEAVAADLTDATERKETLRRLGGVARTALVITEGLLIYLTADQHSALAADLHAVPSVRWWLADIGSPLLLKWMKKTWGKSNAASSPFALFKFAPENVGVFFAPFGWRVETFRSTVVEARRLRREMRLMWLWRFINRISPAKQREAVRTMSGYYLLERTSIPR